MKPVTNKNGGRWLSSKEIVTLLAETALRFLELVQLKNLNMENDPNSEEIDEVTHPNGNYDTGTMLFCSRFPVT